MTPLLFIKLTNQTNSENTCMAITDELCIDGYGREIFKYNIHTTLFDYGGLQTLARPKS